MTCLETLKGFGCKTAFIGGTGLRLTLDKAVVFSFQDGAGMPAPTTQTHQGQIEIGYFRGRPLIQVRGRVHPYESGNTHAMMPIYQLLADGGVDRVIISGAVGSMNEKMPPESLVAVCDHIFFGGQSPLTNISGAFVDMSGAYSSWSNNVSRALSRDVPHAVYAWTHGPHLETPAETKALRAMGADIVGMSMAPEVIMARYLGLEVFGLAAVVNWAAGWGGTPKMDTILAHAAAAAKKLPDVLETVI